MMELELKSSIRAPNVEQQSPLHGLTQRSAKLKEESLDIPEDQLFWDQNHYGLNRADIFKQLSHSQQHDILAQLNHWSLSLSYYIEKFGLNYGARMVLGAQSTEEKSLYTLFSADEVRHRLMIEKHLTASPVDNIEFHPLLPALEICLQSANQPAMVFAVQVILEGFGLNHYDALKQTCRSQSLKNVFADILADEVLHHGMGVHLSQQLELSLQDRHQIEELTALFVRALIEANWVQRSIENTIGEMSLVHKQLFHEQTQSKQSGAFRIARIKQLIQKVGYHGLVENLEAKGVFKI